MTTPKPPGATGTLRPVSGSPKHDDSSVQELYEELYEIGIETRSGYRPTAEQLARDEALRRHNQRTIYVPVAIAIVVAVVVLVLLLALAFGWGVPQSRELIAGLSALVVILFAIPATLMMTLLPLGYLYWWFSRRQQRQENPEYGPMAYRHPVQAFLWRVDSALRRADTAVESGTDAAARPVIRAHSFAAYIDEFAESFRRNFVGSRNNDQK